MPRQVVTWEVERRIVYTIMLVFPVVCLLLLLTAYLMVENHFGYIPPYDCVHLADPQFFLGKIPGDVIGFIYLGSLIGVFVYVSAVMIACWNIARSKKPVRWKLLLTSILIYAGGLYVLIDTDAIGWYLGFVGID